MGSSAESGVVETSYRWIQSYNTRVWLLEDQQLLSVPGDRRGLSLGLELTATRMRNFSEISTKCLISMPSVPLAGSSAGPPFSIYPPFSICLAPFSIYPPFSACLTELGAAAGALLPADVSGPFVRFLGGATLSKRGDAASWITQETEKPARTIVPQRQVT